jgi:4-amino-4-deoxy-L-arabinose transferase-like glycosyltransferase
MWRRRAAVVAAFVVVAVAAGYHTVMAGREPYPGHADPSYYYGLARSLRHGHGFRLDYTWHFLNLPRSAHGLPNDYWMPLPSLLMAAVLWVTGTSLSGALTVGLAAWLGTAALAGLAGWRLTASAPLGAAAALGTLVLPGMTSASLITDGSALLALLAMGVVVTLLWAEGRTRWYAAAGALVGLAELSRQDGLLLAATVAVAVVLLAPRGRRLRLGLAAALAYAVVMAPLFIANLRVFGAPLPPGPRTTAFLTTYEDLYSYGRLRAAAYFDLPLRALLAQRRHWVSPAWPQFAALLGGSVMATLFVGATLAAAARRERRRQWIVALTFPVVLLAFDALVIPVISAGGGWAKSALAATPLLVVGVVATAASAASALVERTGRRQALATACLLAAGLGGAAYEARTGHAAVNRMVAQQEAEQRSVLALARHLPDRSAVVMTRNPWELNELTGHPAVQIPNEPLPTILRVACAARATYLIVDPRREALRDVGALTAAGVVQPVAPDMGLFAFRPCPPRAP